MTIALITSEHGQHMLLRHR